MPEFRVWAPKPALVRLDVNGAVHAMTRSADGWWHTTVAAPADARYGYLLDDDPTVLPDPRSARQPDGVHARPRVGGRPASLVLPGPTLAGRGGRSRAR